MLRMLCGALLFAAAVVVQARAQDPAMSSAGAPFGLSWGISKADAERAGVSLTEVTQPTFGKSFNARNLSKVLTDAELVMLSFGHDDRLWRVAAASRTWQNDSHGHQATYRFQQLVGLLAERYGPGKDISSSPDELAYQKPEYFSYSLFLNKRVQAINWQTKDVDIQLSLRLPSMNDIHYLLIYESRALGAAFRRAHQAREKEAL
jgi:hypothetical protein